MMTIFSAAFSRFGAWIVAAISVAGALFVALRSASNSGKADAKVDQAKADVKRSEDIAVREIDAARDSANVQVEKAKEATDVHSKINRLGDGDAANQLRDKWSRD